LCYAVVLVLAALVSLSASGLEISYLAKPPFVGSNASEQIFLQGEIVPGDYGRFVEFIRQDPDRFLRQTHITIDSPGGDVVEALRLAKLIRLTYLSVRVNFDAGCVSACFFIYVSAVDRLSVPNSVGIHRPYIDPDRVRDLPPAEAQEAQDQALQTARKFLQDTFVPSSLIDTLFQRASTQVYWLTPEDLSSIGFQAPWYEEYLIARCNYKKGAMEAYLHAKAESKEKDLLAEYLRSVQACGRSNTEGERRKLVDAVVSLSDDRNDGQLDDPYIRKVVGLRELIRAKQVTAEAVAATVVTDEDRRTFSFAPSDIQKLETNQTWWLDATDSTNWGHFTVYVRNTTKHSVSSVLFDLTDITCEKTPHERLLLALPLPKPLRPLEDRALRFSTALPEGHALLGDSGEAVCGSIVGAR
jgi:ATP-dependent protease ClpP protease subunit